MIKPINHYSIENPASVFDEEAVTALQLAGRLAAKVNELVKFVNNNLGAIDAAVAAEVQTYIASGAFDKAISTYCGELETRLDYLMNNLGEGSTTMDLEIVDARVGVDGTEHTNLGAAIREQIGALRVIMEGMVTEDTRNLLDPVTCSNATAIRTTDGAVFTDANYWVSELIDLDGAKVITTNTPIYKLAWYNSAGVYLESANQLNIGSWAVPTGAASVRFSFYQGNDDALDLFNVPYAKRGVIIITAGADNVTDVMPRWYVNPALLGDALEKLDIFSTDENCLLDPIKCHPDTGLISSNGNPFEAPGLYWVTDFIPADGLTNVRCSHPIHKRVWYDANKAVAGINGDAPAGAAYLRVQFNEANVPYAKRFQVILCDGARDIAGVNPRYYFTEQTGAGSVRAVNGMGDHLFTIPLTNTPYMSDHTMINGQLYAINAAADDHSEYAPVTVYNVNLAKKTSGYVRTFQHNLGHANSIDYCEATGCLILGDGSNNSALPGAIFILPNAAARDTWEYDDCVKIDLSGKGWGIKCNVVWGESNNGQYNIAYVITNNNADIRKILLTRTNGEFDGGFVLLGHWHGEAVEVNQGTVFHNGKLYTAVGHSQIWMLEHTLNMDGTITVRQFKDQLYDEAGNILFKPFAEGLTIYQGCYLFGASSGDVFVYGDKPLAYNVTTSPEGDDSGSGGDDSGSGGDDSGSGGEDTEVTVTLPAGIYFANENMTAPASSLMEDVSFISSVPNVNYKQIGVYQNGNIAYDDTTVYTGSTWVNINHRIFVIEVDHQVSEEFYTWFMENYKVQGSNDNTENDYTIYPGVYTVNSEYPMTNAFEESLHFTHNGVEYDTLYMLDQADCFVYASNPGGDLDMGEDGEFYPEIAGTTITIYDAQVKYYGFHDWFHRAFTLQV